MIPCHRESPLWKSERGEAQAWETVLLQSPGEDSLLITDTPASQESFYKMLITGPSPSSARGPRAYL